MCQGLLHTCDVRNVCMCQCRHHYQICLPAWSATPLPNMLLILIVCVCVVKGDLCVPVQLKIHLTPGQPLVQGHTPTDTLSVCWCLSLCVCVLTEQPNLKDNLQYS